MFFGLAKGRPPRAHVCNQSSGNKFSIILSKEARILKLSDTCHQMRNALEIGWPTTYVPNNSNRLRLEKMCLLTNARGCVTTQAQHIKNSNDSEKQAGSSTGIQQGRGKRRRGEWGEWAAWAVEWDRGVGWDIHIPLSGDVKRSNSISWPSKTSDTIGWYPKDLNSVGGIFRIQVPTFDMSQQFQDYSVVWKYKFSGSANGIRFSKIWPMWRRTAYVKTNHCLARTFLRCHNKKSCCSGNFGESITSVPAVMQSSCV